MVRVDILVSELRRKAFNPSSLSVILVVGVFVNILCQVKAVSFPGFVEVVVVYPKYFFLHHL